MKKPLSKIEPLQEWFRQAEKRWGFAPDMPWFSGIEKLLDLKGPSAKEAAIGCGIYPALSK